MSRLIQTSGRFLLDTNIILALFSNDNAVLSQFAVADSVFVPAIVIGELYFGAYNSKLVIANLSLVDNLAHRNNVLNCDIETARYYGQIRRELRVKGRPIPENDVWIAALARQHALILATRDAHFANVEGLRVEPWR